MTPRATGWSLIPIATCLLLAACAGPSKLASPSIDAIAQSVRASPESASARDLALAGFAAYLLDGKPDAARELWDAALDRDEDLVALYGRFVLARRALDERAQAELALRMCEVAPTHPLCVVGLRGMGESIGESGHLNAEIERRARALLDQGVLVNEAALHLRLLVAGLCFQRGDIEAGRAVMRDAGVLDRAGLLGPWSNLTHLDWDTAFPPESGELSGTGPLGPIALRAFDMPTGELQIAGDPSRGHIYYWVADLTLAEAGRYALIVDGASAKVFLDGSLLLDRREFAAFLPTNEGVELDLDAGTHRLLVKVPRLADGRELQLSLSRVDGRPSAFTIELPKVGSQASARLHTPAPLSSTFWLTAQALRQALEPDLGPLVAQFAAARASLGTDRVGARILAEALCPSDASTCASPLFTLRAEARRNDPSQSRSVSQGLALHDFEMALKADAFDGAALGALLRHAQREQRLDRVADLLAQLKRAASPNSLSVPRFDLGLAQARGVDSLVTQAAEGALRRDPAHCASLRALFELAKKNDAPARAAHLLEQMATCPGKPSREIGFLRHRGQLAEAGRTLDAILPLAPSDLRLMNLRIELALEQHAQGDPSALDRALAQAQAMCAQWPYLPASQKKLAEVLDRRGEVEAARVARERALALDGSDLQLRQALAIKGGAPLLQDALEDGLAWIARYKKAKPVEDAAAVYVLDSFVGQIHADGSSTGLTQTITRAIDQEGVSKLAEVHVPAGAEILVLRTIKEDGRILEPEPIPDKDSISMPGVEVGDFVELAFLMGDVAPASLAPGFVTPRFYFRSAEDRFFHSTFEVRAPEALALVMDSNLIAPDEIRRTIVDGEQRLRVARDDVPPLAREPNAPPLDELLPWLQFGWSADDARFLLSWADRLLGTAKPSTAIQALADELAGNASGREAIAALYRGVMRRIKGDENLARPASTTLSEERGSRVNLLKALLEVRGFQARLVMVHGNPLTTLETALPTPQMWGNVLLSVSLPEGTDGGGELLLDPGTRWAPFGALPASLSGARAAKLPGPGESLSFFVLPEIASGDLHRVSLALALDASGTLSGQGEDVFEGYLAAQLRPALEKMSPERIRQMVEQSMVASQFDGARLIKFDLQLDEESEGPVVFRYSLEAPHFARRDGDDALVLANGLFTQKLARAWLQLFSRETPLLISAPSQSAISATLTLPKGFTWERSPEQMKSMNSENKTPFGLHIRSESIEVANGKQSIGVEETFQLNQQRIEPEAYPTFGEFLTNIDRLQSTPWRLVKEK
ncbi:MAG: hypothetical protein LBM75_06020 [Myxococcales bacterium]|jgi:tetratricopeptide (TPR) repeat protein|nr:hypothetical protein [Myxococcales bacterium]